MNLLIIGFSGCGKSTQAKLIAQKYGLTHLSMGALLRAEMDQGTEIGQKAKSYVDKGLWAPLEVVFPLIEKEFARINYQNFILDGFPRVVEQAIKIEEFLVSKNSRIDQLIFLDVNPDEIFKRRQAQASQNKRFSDAGRTDETAEAIAQRKKSFEETIAPILNFYQNTNTLFKVDGNRPVEPIFDDIVSKVNSLVNQ